MNVFPALNPTFRYATPEDTARVRALIERVYRGPEARAGWTHEADLLQLPRTSDREVEALIASAKSRFVLVEEGGELIACALISHEGTDAYFGMFAVRPDRQAGGLGRMMLAECERRAGEVFGVRAMVMTVINLRHELITYYERRGYARTGETKPFPFEAVPGEKRRDFHLLWLRKELR